MAAQLTATKGLSARGLDWCKARATTSLPVPVSPSNSTGRSLFRPRQAMRRARARRASLPARVSSCAGLGAGSALPRVRGVLMAARCGRCTARKKNSPLAVCTLFTRSLHRRVRKADVRSPISSLQRLPSSAGRASWSSSQARSFAASTSPSRLSASRPCQALPRYCARL
ncbi:hypothetical protein D3C75_693000 [compost metagenome]